MSRVSYKRVNFRKDAEALIATMNAIIEDYVAQGYRLTVRQLYYQLVARAVIENTQKSYKRVTGIVNDARVGGLMDWDAIEDRTRAFIRRQRWESGKQILGAASSSFHMDMWSTQDCRMFVIIEKEALVGVLERVCHEYDVPLLAARGYPSGTVLREFVEGDVLRAVQMGQRIRILHFGDHDPSGLDMTRDLEERLMMFAYGEPINLERLALNMDQIDELKPPANPAKTTDARYAGYRRRFGDESWELDALQPSYLVDLVRTHIANVIDDDRWQAKEKQVEWTRKQISDLAKGFIA